MSFWKVPKMWTEDCWIIGGGPSMLQQFEVPSELITKVEGKELPFSAYSDYYKPLHSKNVIGTNMAFMLGNWISVLYFCDAQFFRVNKDSIAAFPNIKATCVSNLGKAFSVEAASIKRLKRDYKFGLSFEQDMICWNHNSGAAAINFAILAGAKRILLLGFDMKPQEGRTHWHNAYPNKTERASFKRFLRRFPDIASAAKRAGVEILNVSPDSAIDCFPKVTLKEVL